MLPRGRHDLTPSCPGELKESTPSYADRPVGSSNTAIHGCLSSSREPWNAYILLHVLEANYALSSGRLGLHAWWNYPEHYLKIDKSYWCLFHIFTFAHYTSHLSHSRRSPGSSLFPKEPEQLSFPGLLRPWIQTRKLNCADLSDGKQTFPVIPCSSIDHAFRLFASGEYSDCTIICGQDRYRVHKAIICPRSTFFTAAFRRDMEVREPQSEPFRDRSGLLNWD
jgi:hypothetical protein